MAKEKPHVDVYWATGGKEDVFDWVMPAGGEKYYSINDADADGVDVAANENKFFGEREVFLGEWVWRTVVWMTKEFAINDKLNNTTDYDVEDDDRNAEDGIDM